jgi:serine/threonine protein kinase
MTVKISDFGVSLYVLAAKGSGHKTDKDADFEELMSDKFLNRLAGTPAFLAPELCSLSPPPTPSPEHSSSSRPITTPTTPEKLKYLIDVWALGVTYYCLLFGHPPWEEAGEFQLYKRISTEDFPMADLMGSDKIPTGGRRPTDAKIYPDGVSVLGILDGLLQKDPRKRLSLKVLKARCFVFVIYPVLMYST